MSMVSSLTKTYRNLIAGPSDVISEECVVLAGEGALEAGAVLGSVLLGTISAAAKSGGNTGNGTCTTLSLTSGAQLGVYQVRVTGGTFSASGGALVGTGNGALTMDPTTPTLAGAQAGVYKVVCIEGATDSGTFAVEDPNGVVLGSYVVGAAAFATQIKFTIADGSTDFTAGSYFPITVTAAVPSNGLGSFSVTDPDGNALTAGTIGTAYAGGEIVFTVNDGTVNFIVGDGFDITVAAGSGKKVLLDKDAVDGSAAPVGVLAEDITATADVTTAMITRGELNENSLSFVAGTDVDDVRAALQALGIVLRDSPTVE